MANTQITPFQLTDQFTMDNFNQRINEINTALQNKPSKSPVHVDDANDVTKSGFYTCKTNIPFGYGLANVLAVGDIDDPNNVFTQIAFGVNLNPTNRNAIAVRCYVRGEGFKDWEWFNPPLILGDEYRTTERWNGKPVYVMAVDYGPLPNNTITSANIPGWVSTNRAFSINIVAHGSTETVPVPVGLSGDYSSSYWYINNPNGKLYIRSRVDLSGYTSCYVYIKYTKE